MYKWSAAGTLAALLCVAGVAAQAPQSNSGNQNAQPSQSGQQAADKSKTTAGDSNNSLKLDTAPPPVSAEEDAAEKVFVATPNSETLKKIQMGEEFLQKYPQSRYRPLFYSTLTQLYINQNEVEKAIAEGDKELELNPNDVQVLASLSRAIPRIVNSKTVEPGKLLAKSEEYGKRAVEVTPTIAKPEGLSDQDFVNAKNQTLSDAHSGLGVTYFRLGKYDLAAAELQQSVRLDPNPQADPVNYYVLAIANENTSHFDDAVAAFNKCAALPSPLQAPCKNGAEEAKKKATTQLSAPK
jgi:tetratricopeptide (TPR) repeat protein